MAGRIASGLKLATSTAFKDELAHSFALHRDLRKCLTLSEATSFIEQRKEEIKQYGKTAYLEYLHTLPMFYNFDFSKPYNMRPFEFVMELDDLTPYQEQLRLGCLLKVREYGKGEDLARAVNLVSQQEQRMQDEIKTTPYDAVDACNFLMYQKNSTNSGLFEHSMGVLQASDNEMLRVTMGRMAPFLIKRLSVHRWNLLRQYEFFNEFLMLQYVPNQQLRSNYVQVLNCLCELQLHTIAYQKVPPSIDFIYRHFINRVKNNQPVETAHLQSLVHNFEYLPLSYNQKGFSLLLEKLMQRAQKENVFIRLMPFRRLNMQQMQAFIEVMMNQQKATDLLYYYADYPECKRRLLESKIFGEKLQKQFFAMERLEFRFIANLVISAHLLLTINSRNSDKQDAVLSRLRKLLKDLPEDSFTAKRSKTFPLCTIYHLLTIDMEHGLELPMNKLNSLLSDTLNRLKGQLDPMPAAWMMTEAIPAYANTPHVSIQQSIKNILLDITSKSQWFSYQNFTMIILQLEKSSNRQVYIEALDALYDLIPPQQCQYFAQVYNRLSNKTIKATGHVATRLWEKSRCFATIGRLIEFAHFPHFNDNYGALIDPVKNPLIQLTPTIDITDLQKFKLAQINSIIRFLQYFYSQIKPFHDKFVELSLTKALNLDEKQLKKSGYSTSSTFIDSCITSHLKDIKNTVLPQKILSFYKRVKDGLQDKTLAIVKQMDIKWKLGLKDSQEKTQSAVEEILQTISKEKYNPSHSESMITLLKMNAFEAVNLPQKTQEIFTDVILKGVQKDHFKRAEFTNNITIPHNLRYSFDKEKIKPLIRFGIAILDKISSRQSFEFYFVFLDFGRVVNSSQLITRSLQALPKDRMTGPQFKEIIRMLHSQRQLALSSQFIDSLVRILRANRVDGLVAEALHTLHSIQRTTSRKTEDIFKDLHRHNVQFLIKIIESGQAVKYPNLFTWVMHNLWVAIKTGEVRPTLRPLFLFLQQSGKKIEDSFKNGTFNGVHRTELDMIMVYGHLQFDLGTNKKAQKHEKDLKATFDKNVQQTDQDHLSILESRLSQKGLGACSDGDLQQDTYKLSEVINGYRLHCCYLENGKKHGVYIVDQFSRNSQGQMNGRGTFILEVLKKVTKVDAMLAFSPVTNQISDTSSPLRVSKKENETGRSRRVGMLEA